MTGRQIAGKLHLWLGLASGLVVFIVGVTGCLYVFEKEVQDLVYHDVRFTRQQPAAHLAPPSQVLASVRATLGPDVNPLYYDHTNAPVPRVLAGAGRVRTHQVWAYGGEAAGWTGAYVHPYTGEVLLHWQHDDTWLEWIERGHVHLWLPPEIGRPIVGAATLVFVVLLLTGLWLWWPRRLKAFASARGRRPLFKVTASLGTKRLNYDLHNVVGFYATLALLVIALTGLTWSYAWVEDGVYWLASGGTWPEAEHVHPDSAPPPAGWAAAEPTDLDALYQRARASYPGAEKYGIILPADSTGTIEIVVDYDETNYSGASELHYDQYTGKLVEAERFGELNAGAQLRQMNYDIHAGVIGGFPTKVLAFFASLIAASLPVTGALIWWPTWRRTRRRTRGEDAASEARGDGAPGTPSQEAPATRRVATEMRARRNSHLDSL
jgi:uncharacterized iron-regulated membrane protein